MSQVELFQIKLPAKFKYLSMIGSCIESFMTHMEGIPEPAETTYMLQLAVHEVCNNIVEHAYDHEDGRIWADFSVDYGERRVVVDLRDQGAAFDVASVAEPDLAQPAERGYGLYLARQIMDTVEYKRADPNNHWHMEKKF